MTILRYLTLACFIGMIPAACTEAQVAVVRAFPNLTFTLAVDLQHPGDGTDRLFVVEQRGTIMVFENSDTVTSSQFFLEITPKVLERGEAGLLGLAFHPSYEENGYFYVHYTAPNPLRAVISRFSVDSTNPNRADPKSEKIVMTVPDPYENHNGGQLAFGPDGYLYISLGDGGLGNDPLNSGQDRTSLLGKILRIDVDRTEGGRNYGIPRDNPFAGNIAGYAEEIYAWGLRNPWRFSFDPVDGRIWAGDVGQNGWEEIDIIRKGKNYGWRIMEGYHCSPFLGPNCDSTGLTSPIFEYPRSVGVSITGEHVYRGPSVPELVGKYIYADYGFGTIWSLAYDGVNPTVNTELGRVQYASTFGVDRNGELYVLGYTNGIHRFTSSSAVEDKEETTAGLRLEQNRPNPVTMTTTFSYELPTAGRARLALHDMLGREVKVLLDADQPAGPHDVVADLGTLPPGVYSYSLSADTRTQTRRLVIAR